MWDNCSFKYTIMPPIRRPLCDFNHYLCPDKIGDEELPPPPPPRPPLFNEGIHPALVQFMADTTKHLAEAISRIP
jgi:hypothetical protein